MTVRAAFVTVGDPTRLTGGYLYNRRLLSGLRGNGVGVERVIPCGASPGEQARSAPGFGEVFDPTAYDVVVVDALARVLCAPHLDRWRSVVPAVALVHELPGTADPASADRERTFEEPLLRADRVVAVSGHGRELLLEKGVSAGAVRVVPPGFDGLAPSQSPEKGDGPLRVLCVGQWIPRKGILDLVRAWKMAGRLRVVLDLVGETDADPPYKSRVTKAVAGDPSILTHGPVGNAALAALYASADAFALPSRYEGYGIVFAEAISRGLPVVACRVGPVPDLVGEAALLVPPADAPALSGALGRILSDAGLRKKMSAAATRRAADLPRWSDTVEGFLKVLREAVEERRG